jgi:hypothetical protein
LINDEICMNCSYFEEDLENVIYTEKCKCLKRDRMVYPDETCEDFEKFDF